MKKKILILLSVALVAIFGLAACSSGSPGSATASADSSAATPAPASAATISVGSKAFTEAYILGELYSLALEDNGYSVNRVFNLSIDTVMPALQNGEIDMYAEYMGTALTDILKQEVEMDKNKAYETVKNAYAEQFNLSYLNLTNMEDKAAIVMRKDRADELGVSTISDLQKVSSGLVFGDGVAFTEREDDLPRVEEYYGKFDFNIEIVDPALMYNLLDDGTVDVIPGLTTDPQLASGDYIVLEENIPIWPPQYVAPVVRTETLEANPGLEDVLNGVSAKLSTEDMIAMLDRVVNGGEEFEDVTKEFYEANCK